MTSLSIHTASAYRVEIGAGLLASLGQSVAALGGVTSAALISDSHTAPLYEALCADSLREAGIKVCSFTFPAGEKSKNAQTFLEILNFLADHRLTRTDAVIALGGGVVGDVAGFAAACYLRGIRFIQLPTTLLAAVDSSVGGKTAIDLPAGKNLAGAFYQPSLVLCDTACLDTLPEETFRDGCAEVIKYGILYDPELFRTLAEAGTAFPREAVIARCVALKGQVVAQDERDTGARQLLNLGHTFGHGIEAASGYTVSHGRAVAAGTAIVARAAASMGLCSTRTRDAITEILTKFGLPVTTPYPPEALCRAALSDKKRTGGTVNLIVPEAIGRCRVLPTATEDIPSFLHRGLTP